jgi:alpha-beta hydrolase superfamily lysophospholipase
MQWKLKLSMRSTRKVLGCMLAAFTLSAQGAAMAQTEGFTNVLYSQDGTLAEQLHIPIYEWSTPDAAPRGIVIAVHGVAMHGKSFDYMAKTLAQQGYHVVAADMRGYGRSFDDQDHQCKLKDCRHRIDYQKSFEEVTKLARTVRERYPLLPIFGVGESLGGHMVIRLAAEHPELVDGLVLSAPAVRRHTMIDPYLVVNGAVLMANPRARLDVMPFVRRYASDDPRVIAELGSDPLLRRSMDVSELLKSTKAIRKTITYVPKIPADIPVLVIQGGNDRVLHADGVMTLLSKLHAQDQTVKWFASRGHILLETEYVRDDTRDAVVSWLNAHAESQAMQSKVNRTPNYVAVHSEDDSFQRASFKVQLKSAQN